MKIITKHGVTIERKILIYASLAHRTRYILSPITYKGEKYIVSIYTPLQGAGLYNSDLNCYIYKYYSNPGFWKRVHEFFSTPLWRGTIGVSYEMRHDIMNNLDKIVEIIFHAYTEEKKNEVLKKNKIDNFDGIVKESER